MQLISHRTQNQRVVVLDERELEESIRKDDLSNESRVGNPCCRDSPTQPAPHRLQLLQAVQCSMYCTRYI